MTPRVRQIDHQFHTPVIEYILEGFVLRDRIIGRVGRGTSAIPVHHASKLKDGVTGNRTAVERCNVSTSDNYGTDPIHFALPFFTQNNSVRIASQPTNPPIRAATR